MQRDGTEQKNISLVVMPLISLMTDQAAKLEKSGVEAIVIRNSLSLDELTKLRTVNYSVIMCSPELITGQECHKIFDILTQRQLNVCCLCFDEAHCITSW